ncbi:MAG: efflux RND transporter periplasmic adaptor subunit [Sneathiella sp.]|nr:efflux RND transporter periplasmic adaptor subunit [Sneathiella sp.]
MSKSSGIALKAILPIVLLGAGVLAFQFMVATKPEEKPRPVKPRIWNVAAQEVTLTTVAPEIRVYGTLAAARDVELRSLVAGEVLSVGPNFRDGGRLEAGDLLIEIDPFSYEAALSEKKSSLREAEAKLRELRATLASDKVLLERDQEILKLEERNLARSETLKKKGNISDKSLDTARTSLSRQRQQVAQRQAQLDIMGAKIGQQQASIDRLNVAVEVAERDLKHTRLTAPFAGYVSEISAELGKRLDARDKVARFLEADNLEARFHLSNRQYGVLLQSNEGVAGRPIKVVWSAGTKKMIFNGVIDRVGSAIDAATGGIEVFATLQNEGGTANVRAGAFVEVLLEGEKYPDALSVPDFAVFDDQSVFVVEDGKLVKRAIEVLFDNGAEKIIRGDLKAGEKIVTTRFAEIGPGIQVEVR